MRIRDFFKNKSYAIIGNGPCELGKGRGAEIDSRDVVVRFNNFSLAFGDDYGKRVDVWVCTFWCDTLYIYGPERFKVVYCPMPVQVKRWHDHYPSVNDEMLAHYKAIFPDEKIHDEAWKLMDSPSSGFSFLYWFYRETGSLDKNSLYGFSYFSKDEPHHYCDTQRKTGNHNGEAERHYIQLMCEGKI